MIAKIKLGTLLLIVTATYIFGIVVGMMCPYRIPFGGH